MGPESRYLIWDFDGTLAYREGMWRGTALHVLRQVFPDHPATEDDLRPFLRSGFPWHDPDRHYGQRSADAWWDAVAPVLTRMYVEGAGLSQTQAAELAGQFRPAYLDLRFWRLFDDTLPTLGVLTEAGWRHVILSNHVPELDTIIDGLGITARFEAIHNSALIGYEKPHPALFRHVLETLPDGVTVWMIGDNPRADFAGAGQAGIPAILVRRETDGVQPFSRDLAGVPEILRRA